MSSPLFVLRAGQRVAGYTLERELGEGTYGQVWRAKAGGVDVALKFIRLGKKEGFREWNGVRRVRNIVHPNLMPITGIWMLDQDGTVLDDELLERYDEGKSSLTHTLQPEHKVRPAILVVAMQMADMNLQQKAMQYIEDPEDPTDEGRIPVEDLLSYVRQAAKAIDFLNTPQHDLGEGLTAIQHLDIKPENLMLRGESVLICDFGLAQTIGDTNLTMTSQLGTLAYISPECLEQRPSHRSDQYSLACTYYKLRTGDWPFNSKSSRRQVEDAHLYGKLDLKLLPDGERQVVARATKRKPEGRYESATAFVEALQAAVFGKEKTPSAHGVFGLWQTAASFLVIAALAVGVAVLLMQNWPSLAGSQQHRIDDLWEMEEYGEALDLVQELDGDNQHEHLLRGVAAWKEKLPEKNRTAVLNSLQDVNPIIEAAESLGLDTDYEEAIEEWFDRESGSLDASETLALTSDLAGRVCCGAGDSLLEKRRSILAELKRAGDEALKNGELATAASRFETILAAVLDSETTFRSQALLGLALTHARQEDWAILDQRLLQAESQVADSGGDRAILTGLKALAKSHTGDQADLLQGVLDELVKLVQMPSFMQPFQEHPGLVTQLLALSDEVLTKGIQLRQRKELPEAQLVQLNKLSGDLLDLHAERLEARTLLDQQDYSAARQRVNSTITTLEQRLPTLNDFAKEAGERLQAPLELLLLRINLRDPAKSAADTITNAQPSLLDLIGATNVSAEEIVSEVIDRLRREILGEIPPSLKTEAVRDLIAQMPSGSLAAEKARSLGVELHKLEVVQRLLGPGFEHAAFKQDVQKFQQQQGGDAILNPQGLVDALLSVGYWECELAARSRISPGDARSERDARKEAIELVRDAGSRPESRLFGYSVYLDALTLYKAGQDAAKLADALVSTFAGTETPSVVLADPRKGLAAAMLLRAAEEAFDKQAFGESPFQDRRSAQQAYNWMVLHETLIVTPPAQDYRAFAAYQIGKLDEAIEISDARLPDHKSDKMRLQLMLLNATARKQRFEGDPERRSSDAFQALRRFAHLVGELGSTSARRANSISDDRYHRNVLLPAVELSNRLLGAQPNAGEADGVAIPMLLADADAADDARRKNALARLKEKEVRNDVAAVYAALAEWCVTDRDSQLKDRLAAAQSLFKLAAELAENGSDYKIREAEVFIERREGDLFERIEFVRSIAEPILRDKPDDPRASALMGWVTLFEGFFAANVVSKRALLGQSIRYYETALMAGGPQEALNLVYSSNAKLVRGLTYKDFTKLQGYLTQARAQAESAVGKSAELTPTRVLAQMQLGNVLEDISDPDKGGDPSWDLAQRTFEKALAEAQVIDAHDGTAAFNLGRFLYKRATLEMGGADERYEATVQRSLDLLNSATEPGKKMLSIERAEAYYFQSKLFLTRADAAKSKAEKESFVARHDAAVADSVALFSTSHPLWAMYQARYAAAAIRALKASGNEKWLDKCRQRSRAVLDTFQQQLAAGKVTLRPQDLFQAVFAACVTDNQDLATKTQIIQDAMVILQQALEKGVQADQAAQSLIELYILRLHVHWRSAIAFHSGAREAWLKYDEAGRREDVKKAIDLTTQLDAEVGNYSLGRVHEEQGMAYYFQAAAQHMRKEGSDEPALFRQAAASFENAISKGDPAEQIDLRIFAAVSLCRAYEKVEKDAAVTARIRKLVAGISNPAVERYGSTFLSGCYARVLDYLKSAMPAP